MADSNFKWPTAPAGVGSANRFGDQELNEIITALNEGDSDVWFPKCVPPEEPQNLDRLPEIVRQDVLEDHRENLASAPDEPTQSYRETCLEYLTEDLDARRSVLPESLTPLEDLPKGISRQTMRNWVFYGVTDEMGDREDDLPEYLADESEGGKYLFFTPEETRVLEEIVFEQFRIRPFESAKVPTTINQRDELVLCLYYSDDRYVDDLRKRYQNEDDSWGVASPLDPEQPVIKLRGYKVGR